MYNKLYTRGGKKIDSEINRDYDMTNYKSSHEFWERKNLL